MKPFESKKLAVLGLLVLAGVVGRFAFLHIPNFQPTAAVALFAGFYFASRRTAVLVPVAVLAISNLWLAGYETWGELIAVYAAFAVPVLLGQWLRRGGASKSRQLARWATCLTAPSAVFFVTTNFAVWLFGGRYVYSLAGLSECYAAAIPFYGYSLASELIFVPAIFASWVAYRAVSRTSFAWPRRGALVQAA